MATMIPHEGYARTTDEPRTLGGAVLFAAVLGFALLAVTYPALAAATALGGVGGLLAGMHRVRD